GGYTPTRMALYSDTEILSANPLFSQLFDAFKNAVARPSRVTGAYYSRLSYDVARTTHRVLAKTVTPEDGVTELEEALEAIHHRARWGEPDDARERGGTQ